jgi:uncharacterized membrane protein (UPF0182 family)
MIAAAIVLIMVLAVMPDYIEKSLWMRQLDYENIFWTLLLVRWAMLVSAFLVSPPTCPSISLGAKLPRNSRRAADETVVDPRRSRD